jgi:RNA polymerase sigma-70 factor (ECF subfamily)
LLRRPEERQAPDGCANEGDPAGRIGNETIHSSSFEDALITRLALTQALDTLSPAHREVLYLAFQQGFALQEIAAILELPVGTVKSRISYARRALLRAYAPTQAHEESPL